ncbi:MAG: RidA family protein [Myxococcales bacterium]|nr:RidA family protein [Myxococcales bacterium]
MANFNRVFSGAPWEQQVGYCRAIKAGPLVHVSGTAPVTDDGSVAFPGDGYRQAARCLEIIRLALAELGIGMNAVTRTRMLVTDISRWREYGQAHREAFAESPPATTMVEVKGLIDPKMLIEIEAEAYVSDIMD